MGKGEEWKRESPTVQEMKNAHKTNWKYVDEGLWEHQESEKTRKRHLKIRENTMLKWLKKGGEWN